MPTRSGPPVERRAGVDGIHGSAGRAMSPADMQDALYRMCGRIRSQPLRDGEPPLLPPLSARALASIERRASAKLPTDYHAFLKAVSAGQDAPGRVLYAASRALDQLGRARLELPFPCDDDDADRLVSAGRDPHEGRARVVFEDPVHGALPLGDEGCGWECYLIISGPQRGRIWHGGEAWTPVAVANGTEPHCFLTWIEERLDDWLTPS